jgi:hypothetical protein
LREPIFPYPFNNPAQIPGWESVNLTLGLPWLRGTIYERFSIAQRVTSSDDGATLWFKRCESCESKLAFTDGVA